MLNLMFSRAAWPFDFCRRIEKTTGDVATAGPEDGCDTNAVDSGGTSEGDGDSGAAEAGTGGSWPDSTMTAKDATTPVPAPGGTPKPKSFAERQMEKMGYKKGQGLGASGQGIVTVIEESGQMGRLGLGFEIKGLKREKVTNHEPNQRGLILNERWFTSDP